MSDDRDREPPDRALEVSPPPDIAGGTAAIKATIAHVAHGPGLVRGTRALLAMNQPDGFDCPGCAWPEPAAGERPMVEFCENGAKALAEEATARAPTPAFFARHSVAELRRGTTTGSGQQGRLIEPMWLPEGAHALPADRLGRRVRAHRRAPSPPWTDPSRRAFYTSGRTSNEAAFLYQLFVRAFGTNNLPDCSNMCHESSGVALKRGDRHRQGHRHARGLRPRRPDPDHRPEPGHQPPAHADHAAGTRRGAADRSSRSTRCARSGWRASRTRRSRSSCSDGGTPIAAMHLPVRVGGDVALLKGVMKELLDEDGRRDRARASTTTSSRATPRASRRSRRARRRAVGRLVERERGRPRADARRLAALWRGRARSSSAGRWA